jgi:diguanylate cyclase (GGDEF)-like protein
MDPQVGLVPVPQPIAMTPPSRAPGGWSTQQLAEFVAAISATDEAPVALRLGVERIAEAVGARNAAVVLDGVVAAAQGWRAGTLPTEALLHAATTTGGYVPVPAVGEVGAAVARLDVGETPAGKVPDAVVVVRPGAPLTRVELTLLRGMASSLALTVRLLRTRDEAKQRQELFEGLSEIQRSISHRAPLPEVLDAIVAATHDLLGDDLPALLLCDAEDPEILNVAATRGLDGHQRMLLKRRAVGEGVGGAAVSEGRLIVVDDYQGHTTGMAAFREEGVTAAMAVPVHENGEIIGSLMTASRAPGRRYSQPEQDILTSLAEHASLALNDAKTVAAMTHQALHDSLTGLPNRVLFHDRLDHATARAERSGGRLAVLFCDLDRFKTVNDSLGHQAGDDLLVEVARRLASCLRGGDTAARLGGDEFAILLEELEGPEVAETIADRVLEALAEPVRIRGRDVFARASIGIARSGPGTGDLLRSADAAMYRAKAEGRSRHAVFEPAMQEAAVDKLDLETDLQRAVERGELEVHYQPIMALPDAVLVGFEALVRWRHPERGLIPPASFIPLAEETGLIEPIGRHVLNEACVQAAAWRAAHPAAGLTTMSVNLSVRQLDQPRLVDDVAVALAKARLPPSCLLLEITETMLMGDTDQVVARLDALKSLGVRLAIDDFGTGYSSLRYLRRFPLDVLKMAKPFVDGLAAGTRDDALAGAIVDLGANLGLDVIAEGIEVGEQADRLGALGCGYGQGYHFARPLPALESSALLAPAVARRSAAADAAAGDAAAAAGAAAAGLGEPIAS